ncbi:DUF4124 domain-containing protein [Thioalkalivibrio sp. ALgr3]|uniref:DUF4124 domain-containing protein n=1 Tax=Thioalkalivibrio sp. ALgr3 TaxID=1239292 RepID=UPI000366BFA2|nr:DUF4124 domain-containing protein [Thioalkalivibrio sp. ALgr3]
MYGNGMAVGVLLGALAMLLAMSVAPAVAGDIHRWVDDDGTVRFSDKPRPESSDRERQVYDRQGFVREVVPAPPTAEEREAAAEERRRAEQAQESGEGAARDQAARKRQLERAYDSLAEIESLRERRIAALENNIRMSERQARILERERDRIERQQARNPDSAALRARYADELEDVQGRLERERAYQERQQARIDEMNAQFDADAEDYRELVLEEED